MPGRRNCPYPARFYWTLFYEPEIGLCSTVGACIRVVSQPSCLTCSPIRWAKWRMLWVWSP